jgi:hypothetical protein
MKLQQFSQVCWPCTTIDGYSLKGTKKHLIYTRNIQAFAPKNKIIQDRYPAHQQPYFPIHTKNERIVPLPPFYSQFCDYPPNKICKEKTRKYITLNNRPDLFFFGCKNFRKKSTKYVRYP